VRKLFAILFLLLAGPALAQNTITFSSDVVQAAGSATPTLTWDTAPLADNCVASGDWSGDKGGAGNETLPTITSSATYNLTCSWPDDTATLSWTPPTENTDGTAYTDPDGYLINFGQAPEPDPVDLPGPLDSELALGDPAQTSTVIPGLAPGTWSFVIRARNQAGTLSDFSNVASKVISEEESTESIGITVNPVPQAPSGFAVE